MIKQESNLAKLIGYFLDKLRSSEIVNIYNTKCSTLLLNLPSSYSSTSYFPCERTQNRGCFLTYFHTELLLTNLTITEQGKVAYILPLIIFLGGLGTKRKS